MSVVLEKVQLCGDVLHVTVCCYLFQRVKVVAVGVEAVAVFREQNGSNQPADGEQQVGQTEQEQRLQLQTHKVMMQFKLLQIFSF